MRTRRAYTTFEQTVVTLYNRGVLTPELLDTLAWMYQGMDVDSAGSRGFITHDGKDVQQVCIALINPSFELIARGSCDDDEDYWEKELKEWSHIAGTRWGWSSHVSTKTGYDK